MKKKDILNPFKEAKKHPFWVYYHVVNWYSLSLEAFIYKKIKDKKLVKKVWKIIDQFDGEYDYDEAISQALKDKKRI